MPDNFNILAFDCGATSGRALLATFKGKSFEMKEVLRFPNKILYLNGRYYWNVYSMFEHFKEAISSVMASGVRIDSIGVDTWGVDFGFIGEDGSLLGLPRSYRDPYTSGVPEEVFKLIPKERLYGVTGIQILDFNSIFQLYAQKKEGCAALKYGKKLLFMPDLLTYLLTGEAVCEYTMASTSALVNQKTRSFEYSLLEDLGLNPSLLGQIIQPGTVVGLLSKEIADETGAGRVPVVAVAGHDTASAVVAVPSSDEKFAYLSSGTWSLMGIESPSPIINEKSERLNFTNEGGIEGTTRFLKNITGMWLLEQCRKVWKKEGREYTYAQIEDMAEKSLSFESTFSPDDRRFANPENMDKEIRDCLRETGQKTPSNDGEMVSCIYHSLVKRYCEVVGMLRDFAPFEIDKLYVIGGGSANSLMSRMTADALGIPVIAGPVEATAIGNVMVQAKTAGIVKDRWEIRALVKDNFEVKVYEPHR